MTAPNCFYSALAQSAAAIVGLIGAFNPALEYIGELAAHASDLSNLFACFGHLCNLSFRVV